MLIIINKYKIESVALWTPSIFGSNIQTSFEKIIELINDNPKNTIKNFSIALVLAFLDNTKDREYIIKIIKIKIIFPKMDIIFMRMDEIYFGKQYL